MAKADVLAGDVQRYEYHIGLDYIHVYDNTLEPDGSEDYNVIAEVFNEDIAIKIVDALND